MELDKLTLIFGYGGKGKWSKGPREALVLLDTNYKIRGVLMTR